jgi:hypothetical protein
VTGRDLHIAGGWREAEIEAKILAAKRIEEKLSRSGWKVPSARSPLSQTGTCGATPSGVIELVEIFPRGAPCHRRFR